MNQLSRRIVFVLSLGIFAYVSLGYVFARTNDKAYRSLTVFSEVLERVQQDYVDEPNMRLVTVGALHGLLESLDAESSYLSPREYSQYKKDSERSATGQIGAALSKRFGYISVVSVLPDSPAQKAGLRDGNLLEGIVGFTTREMSIGQAQVLLAGEPGTTVKLSVVRRGSAQPREVEITRAVIEHARLLTDREEGDVAYVRVPEFNTGRTEEIRQRLAQFEHQGAHKLILDLRDCALGQIPEAISAAQLFLPSGTITTLKGQTVARTFSADPGKVAWSQPMTVLINDGTAGAAEILAAAIADNHRGETVGENTFGTASEQKLITLDDGAALILTVADYYSPANKLILNEGVAPHVEVRASGGDLPAVMDKEEKPAIPTPGQLPSADDPVMKKALEILKGATSTAHAA